MTDPIASPPRPRTAAASRPPLAEPITSRANPFVRDVRALRERSRREASGRLFVEGIRLVTAAVRQGHRLETLLVSPETLTSALALDLVRAQAAAGVPVRHCTAHVFAGLSWRERPQGLGAILRQRWTPLAALPAGGGPPGRAAAGPGWIALDAVRDPGNLGTILRTADAAGCAGVILLGHTADPYDPVAVRASMGAVFALPLVRTDFPALLEWCARKRVPLVGTSPLAPVDYRAARYRPPVVLLMGNERTGLSPQQQAACTRVVRIPMAGQSDSLNLAVATGIMLFELRRAGPAP